MDVQVNFLFGDIQLISYLKLLPNPLACCRVWENISYFLMSLSDTDLETEADKYHHNTNKATMSHLLANFMASSKCLLVISGTGSSSSSTSIAAPCTITKVSIDERTKCLQRQGQTLARSICHVELVGYGQDQTSNHKTLQYT